MTTPTQPSAASAPQLAVLALAEKWRRDVSSHFDHSMTKQTKHACARELVQELSLSGLPSAAAFSEVVEALKAALPILENPGQGDHWYNEGAKQHQRALKSAHQALAKLAGK